MSRKKSYKPYFRTKGRYQDGRKRVVIEWEINGKIESRALPKPEEIIEKLGLVNGQVKD